MSRRIPRVRVRYAAPGEVRYAVTVDDHAGRVAAFAVPATGASTCVTLPPTRGPYRVVGVATEWLANGHEPRRVKGARIHLAGEKVIGLERDD